MIKNLLVYVPKQVFLQDPPDGSDNVFVLMSKKKIVDYPAWFTARFPSGQVGVLGQPERTAIGNYVINLDGKTFEWKEVYMFAKVEQGILWA